MIHSDISKLTRGSGVRVYVSCDFEASEKCKGTQFLAYRDVVKTRSRNKNKDICMCCSNRIKGSGANSNAARYNYDRGLFREINSADKAYILGLIASDGHLAKDLVSLVLTKTDGYLVEEVAKFIGVPTKVVPAKGRSKERVSMRACSREMSLDICSHLKIIPGPKYSTVCFPDEIPNELKRHFARGYFDGDGFIAKCNIKNRAPSIVFTTSSINMVEGLQASIGIKGSVYRKNNGVYSYKISARQCMKALAYLYTGNGLRMERKYDIYRQWLNSY